MKRFIIFPIVLGFCGALLPLVCYVESTLALYPLFVAWSSNLNNDIWQLLSDAWDATWLYGISIGLLGGITLAIWDLLRNRHKERSLILLLPNLLWCNFYVLIINIINAGIFALLTTQITFGSPSLQWILKLPFASAALLNFTAILWAAIRSITTKDILTPRVLRDKLRERSRLNSPISDNCDN